MQISTNIRHEALHHGLLPLSIKRSHDEEQCGGRCSQSHPLNQFTHICVPPVLTNDSGRKRRNPNLLIRAILDLLSNVSGATCVHFFTSVTDNMCMILNGSLQHWMFFDNQTFCGAVGTSRRCRKLLRLCNLCPRALLRLTAAACTGP